MDMDILDLRGFCLYLTLFHLNAVDLDAVGSLAWGDAVLHLHPRQKVPPERSITRLQHPHIHAIGSKGHLEDNYKHMTDQIDELMN